MARDIANRIKIRLSPAEQARLSGSRLVDPQAYQSYLEGRYYWNLRTEEGLKKGIEYFHDAIAKDPHYALAYAAEEVTVRKSVEISPDPGDNCFCACAEEGSADFLVTLNAKDFPQAKLMAKVVSPAQFLGMVGHVPSKG